MTGLFPEAQERPNSSPAAVRVGVGALSALMGRLRNDGEFSFDFLLDHTAIDWIDENVFELFSWQSLPAFLIADVDGG